MDAVCIGWVVFLVAWALAQRPQYEGYEDDYMTIYMDDVRRSIARAGRKRKEPRL